MPYFTKVLIANRGEIAVRVMRACHELGIATVAVYSDADRFALHTRTAQEAVGIGPAPARESYLNIPAIIAAAHATGAQAIHPGYGFLSENADFAAACQEAEIVFIGPPPAAIRLMGSKTAAKAAVMASNVPTVPGYQGADQSPKTMLKEAKRVGFPVMIKAAAGGGGKGMRAVPAEADFADALTAAQREAQAAFGDATVFLEKLIVHPRHIEFQILADQHGTCLHFGERECSIQRRHQKIIEEAPSVALTPDMRAAMGQAAVRAAQAAGYVNAGTVEFMLDQAGTYYFLEMNTRLQVEHAVTEQVTGRDLVHLQLAVAAGEKLSLAQEEITPRGHAIEVRLYAEDPVTYLPATGTALVFDPPRGPGIRLDSGIQAGDAVSMHYDPMLAKLIVTAPDRAAAIARLRIALVDFGILGLTTNLPLLRLIIADPRFAQGETYTDFLNTPAYTGGPTPRSGMSPDPTPATHASACYAPRQQALSPPHASRREGEQTGHRSARPTEFSSPNSDQFPSPSADGEGLGVGPPAPFLIAAAMCDRAQQSSAPAAKRSPWAAGALRSGTFTARYLVEGQPVVVELRDDPATPGAFRAKIDGSLVGSLDDPGAEPILARRDVATGEIILRQGVPQTRVWAARRPEDGAILVTDGRQTLAFAKPQPLDVDQAAHGGVVASGQSAIAAPMAGTIIQVRVAVGDTVTARQTLVILGAMKMEHALIAPFAGTVRRVTCKEGDVVTGGATLVELIAEAGNA